MTMLRKRKYRQRDETLIQIVEKADELFHQYGYGKTTVADIAHELGMSSANIYKFFPSKEAIVEVCAERSLAKTKERLIEIQKARGSSISKLELLALEFYQKHTECFKTEKEIYKLVLLAKEQNWECVRFFEEYVFQVIQKLIKEGVESGEFNPTDVKQTTQAILDSLTWITHPLLYSELEPQKVRSRLRSQIKLLQKALQ